MRCLEAAAQSSQSTRARSTSRAAATTCARPTSTVTSSTCGLGARRLVLALPVRILCTAECRGLCAICGANLNEDPEHAHEREPDPRWAKLSELKLD